MSDQGVVGQPPESGQQGTTKQFEVAIDVAKQMMTLATAILTLTITFSKDVRQGATAGDRVVLSWAWLLFSVSILGGIWLMYAANGSIAEPKTSRPRVARRPAAAVETQDEDELSESDRQWRSIYDSNTAIPMAVQQLAFIGGLGLTAWFGARTL